MRLTKTDMNWELRRKFRLAQFEREKIHGLEKRAKQGGKVAEVAIRILQNVYGYDYDKIDGQDDDITFRGEPTFGNLNNLHP